MQSRAPGQPDPLSARSLPWFLNAMYYNATRGTAMGTLTGIHLFVSGSGCRAVVDGTAAGAFDGTEKFRNKNDRPRPAPTNVVFCGKMTR